MTKNNTTSKPTCSVVGCKNKGFILCDEHNALSEQNKDKPIKPTNIKFLWDGKELPHIGGVDFEYEPNVGYLKKEKDNAQSN